MFPRFRAVDRANYVPTIAEALNWDLNLIATSAEITWNFFMKFCKTMWTLDSWEDLLRMQTVEPHYLGIYKLLVTQGFPVHMLPFVSPTHVGTDGQNSVYRLYAYYPESYYGGDINWNYTYCGIEVDRDTGEATFSSPTALSRLKTKIDEAVTAFESTGGFADRQLGRESVCYSSAYLARLTKAWFAFYTGGKCFHQGNNSYTRGQFTQAFGPPSGNYDVKFRNGMFALTVEINYANRSALYYVFNYSTRVQNYLNYVIREKNDPKNANIYGVELEVSTNYHPSNLIDAQEKRLFFFCKSDSSITGNKQRAMELVTVPATLNSHKKLWSGFFKSLGYQDKFWDVSTRTNNGMHVHCSVKNFRDGRHKERFGWWFANPSNSELNFEISERHNRDSMSSYAQFPVTGRSCNFPFRTETIGQLTETAGLCWSWFVSTGHRAVINPSNGKTVEVRLFRGIVSPATIVKNLEYVDSIIEFTRDIEVTDVNLENYLQFLAGNRQKYPNIFEFIQSMDFENLKIEAEIQELVNKCLRDTRKVAAAMKPLIVKYDLDMSCVYLLNSIMGTKAFIWNSERKEVVSLNSNVARLIDFDDKVVSDNHHAWDDEIEALEA